MDRALRRILRGPREVGSGGEGRREDPEWILALRVRRRPSRRVSAAVPDKVTGPPPPRFSSLPSSAPTTVAEERIGGAAGSAQRSSLSPLLRRPPTLGDDACPSPSPLAPISPRIGVAVRLIWGFTAPCIGLGAWASLVLIRGRMSLDPLDSSDLICSIGLEVRLLLLIHSIL